MHPIFTSKFYMQNKFLLFLVTEGSHQLRQKEIGLPSHVGGNLNGSLLRKMIGAGQTTVPHHPLF